MRNSTFANSFAELDSAGAIYLGEYASALIEGDHNNFTGNICDIYGGVLAATTNTNVTVEGGWFKGNEAGEVRMEPPPPPGRDITIFYRTCMFENNCESRNRVLRSRILQK